MFGSRISAGATEKLPGWEKPHAKTVAWSHDMEGHGKKCVERNCELANKKDGAVQSLHSILGQPSLHKERIGIGRRIVQNMLTNYLEMLLLFV